MTVSTRAAVTGVERQDVLCASGRSAPSQPSSRERNLRVLVLSRAYPNNVLPLLGLWVEGLVRYCAKRCCVKVVAPVPYCPPLPWIPEQYRRFRRIEAHCRRDGVDVYHPRFVVPPGYWFHGFESTPYLWGVKGFIDRLRRSFPFDLIHAHFVYPDGYVAARLARRYGVPMIITEQAPWRPWLDKYAIVRRRALWAARQSDFLIAISRAARESIVHFAGDLPKITIIPDGVDTSVFTLPPDGCRTLPDQLLFVGVIRPVKGVDVLLRALRLLTDRGRKLHLVLVGESFYASYRREYERLQRMVVDLDLSAQVKFMGRQPLPEVVRYMQQSAVLVLPSRQESLGMVVVEAIACGTPVVATRSGGPEDIVVDDVGVLVPAEDPEALAEGIERVLERRSMYNAEALRAYAVQKFGLDSVADQVTELYARAVLSRGPRPQSLPSA